MINYSLSNSIILTPYVNLEKTKHVEIKTSWYGTSPYLRLVSYTVVRLINFLSSDNLFGLYT